jgi:DNA replication protein DnaC
MTTQTQHSDNLWSNAIDEDRCPRCTRMLGEDQQCVYCILEAEEYREALSESEMPKRYRGFDNFKVWEKLPVEFVQGKITSILAAREMVRQPATPFSLASLHKELADDTTPRHSLILVGSNGMGKTALASTVANLYVAQMIGVKFITPRGLWFQVKASFDGKGESETEIMKGLIETPLLVIDEFNLLPSDYFRGVMEHIIRERYNSDEPKPIVVTTNAEIEELDDIWKRQITSPLFEMGHLVRMGGLPLRDESKSPSKESF